MHDTTSIVWLYRDLRLTDNEALTIAATQGPIIPLYIFDDSLERTGGAAKWWLEESLRALSKSFANHKIPLVLRRGNPLFILRDIAKATGARHIHWARRYEKTLAERDAAIEKALNAEGFNTQIHTGFLLLEPEKIHSASGSSFKVYTPFSKVCFAALSSTPPLPAPKNLQTVPGILTDPLESWCLVPKTAQWPKGLAAAWQPGEKAGQERLRDFISEILPNYNISRDRPDLDGTSRLSPYLHFGNISPRQAWYAAHTANKPGSERFLLELLWREFSWHLFYATPDLDRQPLQKSFATFPWREDVKGLRAWQSGMTGFPIIDAGMRQLWQIGWMHNRVRMIVASFLIKDLLIDWREGMHWFWDTLVDADEGNNAASWQWVAGCGADAAPYFRIFNPTLQAKKFDPKGDYIRRYIPELAKLPSEFIHEPSKAPAEILEKAGITLGKTYPHPMLDHAAARKRALYALKTGKKGPLQGPETADLFD